MARTAITPLAKPTPYDTDGTLLTLTAVDTIDKNSVLVTSDYTMIIVQNDGSSEATLTIDSVAETALGNREGDITLVLAAGTHKMVLVPTLGFRQDGVLHLDTTDADLNVAAFPY